MSLQWTPELADLISKNEDVAEQRISLVRNQKLPSLVAMFAIIRVDHGRFYYKKICAKLGLSPDNGASVDSSGYWTAEKKNMEQVLVLAEENDPALAARMKRNSDVWRSMMAVCPTQKRSHNLSGLVLTLSDQAKKVRTARKAGL